MGHSRTMKNQRVALPIQFLFTLAGIRIASQVSKTPESPMAVVLSLSQPVERYWGRPWLLLVILIST